MTYNRATTSFLVALVLCQVSNPLAHAQLLGPAIVSGQLFCSPTGNLPGPPLAGTNVTVICNILGVSTVVGQNTTNVNGVFNINVPAITGLILGLPTIPCVAIVRLPLNSTVCPVLSTTTGFLVSTLQSVGTVIAPILGLVQRLNVVGFFNVTTA